MVVAVMGLTAAPAQAGWKFERAQEIAYAVWGAELVAACPTAIGIRTNYGTTAAAAGVDAFASAWAQPGVCTINFSPTPGVLSEFPPYCSIFLHEAGHIAGYGHDHAGHGGIMAPNPFYVRTSSRVVSPRRHGRAARHGRTIVEWIGTDPRCDRRGVPFMESRGLL